MYAVCVYGHVDICCQRPEEGISQIHWNWSYPTWVLRTKLQFSEIAANALNHWAIQLPVPYSLILITDMFNNLMIPEVQLPFLMKQPGSVADWELGLWQRKRLSNRIGRPLSDVLYENSVKPVECNDNHLSRCLWRLERRAQNLTQDRWSKTLIYSYWLATVVRV